MRNIILDLALTLDGFIEGPNGEIDWCIMDEEMGFDKFLAGIDTIFYGRKSYELWGQYLPGKDASPAEKDLWQAVHSKKKYVFSGTPQEDANATYISAGVPEKVREIKEGQGKNIWLYGGASLITSFIQYGLIDVYRLSIHPVILGSGKPLFSGIKESVNLRAGEVRQFTSGVTLLTYYTA